MILATLPAADLLTLLACTALFLGPVLVLMLNGASLGHTADEVDARHGREQAALFDQDAAVTAAVRTVTRMRGES